MLADFYIPRLPNHMKIAVQKNNLGGKIWYRSLDHVKKNGKRSNYGKTIEFFIKIRTFGKKRHFGKRSKLW